MNTVQILEKARDLISDKSKWIQGMMYADEEGYHTVDLSKSCRFCAIGSVAATVGLPRLVDMGLGGELPIGSVFRELYGNQIARAVKYLNAASEALYGRRVWAVNDGCPSDEAHDNVMKVFDKAIRNAKRRHVNGKRYAKA